MARPPGTPRRRRRPPSEDRGEVTGLFREVTSHAETSPLLSGGDLDADWQRAESSGEEAVGGSAATPDQDIVDDLARALGVEQAADAEFEPSAEILRARDRHYWHLERRAAAVEEEHSPEEET